AIAASPSKDVADHLRQALERARQETSLKVLTIAGAENSLAEQKLHEAIVSFPYPIVAAIKGDAVGAGFLLAALCDFIVCSEDAQYGYNVSTGAEGALFRERFGVLAHDVLGLSGKQLRATGWTCPVVPA